MEKDMIQNIAEGEFAIVFAHPEAILNTVSGKDLLSKRQFIDHWDITNQSDEGAAKHIGSQQPHDTPESPDRTNIFLKKLHKSKSGDTNAIYESIFKTECDDLKKDPYNYPVTLLFMPLYYISQAAAYLKHLIGDGDITTSCYAVLFSRQDKVVLKTTGEELQIKNPRIRLILTSSVAGMGFDPPSVKRIIHARSPRNLSQYLQVEGDKTVLQFLITTKETLPKISMEFKKA
ncbi:uncharacterized protein LOC127846303 [Dreissena polymorpha]|nr:uncharacterized protein LOC127846303 [Dreissena polymorpha]